MPRRQATIELDEQLLEALSRAAAHDGVAPDDLVEAALRVYFGLRGIAVMNELAATRKRLGPQVGDDEAMALANTEISAYRMNRATWPSAFPRR